MDEVKPKSKHREWKERELKARRAYGIIKLGGCCARCGEEDWELLQFDHIRRWDKDFEICRANMRSMVAFMKELRLCRLLCITCHAMKSNKERYGGTAAEIERWIRDYQKQEFEEMPF